MALFIVASSNPENDDALSERIAQRFEHDHYEIGRGQWLISSSGTSKEVSETLVSDADPLPNMRGFLVASIGAYWGRSPVDMWEWMSSKISGEKSAK